MQLDGKRRFGAFFLIDTRAWFFHAAEDFPTDSGFCLGVTRGWHRSIPHALRRL
jgi:hypothetical protein